MKELSVYKDMLTKEGMKSTKQRNAIIELLKEVNMPFSAEEIFLAIKSKGVSTSLSTIYRNLETMVNKKIIAKTTLMNEEKAKFSLISDEHRHLLICLGCASMIDIEECPLKELESSLHNSTDFKVTGHKLEVYGYCPACQDMEKN